MKNRPRLHQTCMSCMIKSDVCGHPPAPVTYMLEKPRCPDSLSVTRRFSYYIAYSTVKGKGVKFIMTELSYLIFYYSYDESGCFSL